jgi:bisphosphoglycerate-independent phosphoglycerate mutase (AlkP superfamily)
VATYDLQPLSAFELTEALVPELEKEEVDFVCLNFATAWWEYRNYECSNTSV